MTESKVKQDKGVCRGNPGTANLHRPATPCGGFSGLFKVLPLGGQFGQKKSETRKALEYQQK